jgi:hypothetical protein
MPTTSPSSRRGAINVNPENESYSADSDKDENSTADFKVTEGAVAATIRMGTRLRDVTEMIFLMVDFEKECGCTPSPNLFPFYLCVFFPFD